MTGQWPSGGRQRFAPSTDGLPCTRRRLAQLTRYRSADVHRRSATACLVGFRDLILAATRPHRRARTTRLTPTYIWAAMSVREIAGRIRWGGLGLLRADADNAGFARAPPDAAPGIASGARVPSRADPPRSAESSSAGHRRLHGSAQPKSGLTTGNGQVAQKRGGRRESVAWRRTPETDRLPPGCAVRARSTLTCRTSHRTICDTRPPALLSAPTLTSRPSSGCWDVPVLR